MAKSKFPIQDLTWLESLTLADGPPITRRPFSLEAADGLWACATDGKILIGLRVTTSPFDVPDVGETTKDYIRHLLTVPLASAEVEFSTLSAWAGLGQDGCATCETCQGFGAVECEECSGAGTEPCICPHCEDEHEADCESCTNGRTPCPDCGEDGYDPGLVGDRALDRRLLRRALAHLRGDRVQISCGGVPWADTSIPAVLFETNDWRLVVMPLTLAGDPGWRNAPRLALACR